MIITIKVNDKSSYASTSIKAETWAEAANPLGLLQQAICEIQYQIDNFKNCPIHRSKT